MSARSLLERLQQHIEVSGPISIAQYMNLCLSDPDFGYYTTREPFGAQGDFTTAPEISQMFGELVGAVCLQAYEALGKPSTFQLVELGPGRGSLMADVLRVAAHNPGFLRAAELNLVEISPRLQAIQADTLQNAPLKIHHRDQFQDVQDGPIILIANEFFDALPIHQYIKAKGIWHERHVGLAEDGNLTFGIGTAKLDEADIPKTVLGSENGSLLETQPFANAIAEDIGTRIKEFGGFALFIDYGYAETSSGETLQALYKQKFDDVLTHPGEADLTAHVNFEALANAAMKGGAKAMPLMEQGDFLLKCGLLERAGALGSGKTIAQQEAIRDAVERLAAPEQMGQLFKVLALTSENTPIYPFGQSS